jgi:ubiquinone/menaquinone biosynthesis C-methylase UbiE
MNGKPVYEVGRVYDSIPPASKFYSNIEKYASNYYRTRNRTYSESLDPIKNTVDDIGDELIVHYMKTDARQGLKFLDVGGATGKGILSIEKRLCIELEKHIMDIDRVSVDEATKRDIHAIQGNVIDGLPYDKETFDAISLRWVLSGIPPDKRKGLIAEINRVLKPKGIFYLEDEKYGEFAGDKEFFEEILKPLGYDKGTLFIGIFESTGLESQIPKDVPKSILDASDRNPAYRLISLPMGATPLQLDRVEQMVDGFFNLEKVYFIGAFDEQRVGRVISTDKTEIKTRYQNTAGILMAILNKK